MTVFTLALMLASMAAQESAPPPGISFRIVSPGEDAYISGPTLLRLVVDPPAAAREILRVSFFADGVLTCTIDKPPYECDWDAGGGVEEHLVRAVVTFRNGARVAQNVRTKGVAFAEHIDVDVVQVTATVTTGRRFVRGLNRDVFRVFEDDVPQIVTYFGSENTPLEIVVAIDISGSMGEAMPAAKQAVKQFLGSLRSGDQVTLMAFNDNVYTLARRVTEPAARIRAVERLAAWGGTALYDVIVRALGQLGRQQGRRALVLFTDGEDQNSRTTLESAIRAVEGSDATVFVVGLGRGTEVDTLKRIQQRIATVSGGRAFHTADVGELQGAFAEIIEELSNQYLLGYPPKNTKRDNTWRRIRVEISGGSHDVRARQGYRAAPRTGSQ